MNGKRWVRELVLENQELLRRMREEGYQADKTIGSLRRRVEDLEAALTEMAPQTEADRVRTVDASDWNDLVEKMRSSEILRRALRMVLDDIERGDGEDR